MLTDGHFQILKRVPTSYAWNWRDDYVEDLEKLGLVKIEHGRSNWSLTDHGQDVLRQHLPEPPRSADGESSDQEKTK